MRILRFLASMWKANLLAAMEFRTSFILQMAGMMLNDLAYFMIWIIFFQRFERIGGWGLREMLVLFGIVAIGFGITDFFFGNATRLAEIISAGQLDYYLSLPQPVLLHTLAGSSRASGLGDLTYGLLSLIVAAGFDAGHWARFLVAITLSATVFVSFLILVNSLSFWMGSAQMLSGVATNAIITFSIYPITLFDGPARFFLFTIIPAGLIGALPAEFVSAFTWPVLFKMLFGAGLFLVSSVTVFYAGLRRYESGSAIQAKI